MMAYYYPAEEIAENIKSGLDELVAFEITGAAVYSPEIAPVALCLFDLIQGRRCTAGVEVMADAYEDSREKLQELPEYRRARSEKDRKALEEMAGVYRAAVFDNCREKLQEGGRERRK